MAQAEIEATIAAELVLCEITGKQLASVMRALNTHWHKACAWQTREVLNEGAIWDDGKQKLREIED
jgi:hypothetical protein